MTEIEKMFENANIKKIHEYQREIDNGDPRFTGISHSDSYIVYPDFTAEKQLELIKWLAIRFNSDYMSYWHNEIKDVWIFRLHDLTELSSEEPYVYEGMNKDFTESLCNLINDLWQSLTDPEKEEIRRILK